MTIPRYDELEIVGFNGAPLVECGRALPVARRKSDGMHCVLDTSEAGSLIAWFSEAEATAFAQAGRWTQFEKPLTPPRTCDPGAGGPLVGQPMVIFADEGMLDVADAIPRPARSGEECLAWRKLNGHPASILASCDSGRAVEQMLDKWADALIKRFDAMARMGPDRECLGRIADFALCAARSRDRRWRAYLRYASTQDADAVRRTFEQFTSREFPDVPQDDFARELRSYSDVIAAVFPSGPPSIVYCVTSSAAPKVRGIAVERALNLIGSNGR